MKVGKYHVFEVMHISPFCRVDGVSSLSLRQVIASVIDSDREVRAQGYDVSHYSLYIVRRDTVGIFDDEDNLVSKSETIRVVATYKGGVLTIK